MRKAILLLAVAGLSACTLGPDYEVSTRRREAARPPRRHAAATAGCRPLRGARPWP